MSGKTAREKKRNTWKEIHVFLKRHREAQREPNRETWTEKQKDTQKQTRGREKERVLVVRL